MSSEIDSFSFKNIYARTNVNIGIRQINIEALGASILVSAKLYKPYPPKVTTIPKYNSHKIEIFVKYISVVYNSYKKKGKKKIVPINACIAVINKAENLLDKYLATIVYPAPQNIAQNSRKLPNSGLGATIVV